MRKPKELMGFSQILPQGAGGLFAIKKPSEVDKIQAAPKTEETQVVFATGAHHGKKAPEGKSRKSEP